MKKWRDKTIPLAHAILWLYSLSFLVGCTNTPPPTTVIEATSTPVMTVASPTPMPSKAVTSAEKEAALTEFTDFVQAAIKDQAAPGMAVAVIQGDKTLLAKGFGTCNIETNQPVTADSLFHVASTHKSMVSMMIASMVDDGLFTWNTPVIQLYPAFKLPDKAATKKVTLVDLLSMKAGISEKTENYEDTTPRDVFETVATTPLLGQPGEVYEYSNVSVSIAAYIALIAQGSTLDTVLQDYYKAMHERVLDKIGMKTATMFISEALTNPNHCKSHGLDDDNHWVLYELEEVDDDPLVPSGALKASVSEMAAYISTQINRGVAPNGQRIVSEENLMETWQPHLESYGLGWEELTYNDVKILSHTGSYDNYLSVIGFLPDEGLGFVILTNGDMGDEFLAEVPTRFVDIFVTE